MKQGRSLIKSMENTNCKDSKYKWESFKKKQECQTFSFIGTGCPIIGTWDLNVVFQNSIRFAYDASEIKTGLVN